MDILPLSEVELKQLREIEETWSILLLTSTLALEAAQVPLDHISAATIEKTLATLPEYVHKHNLPYGIAHELFT